MRKLFLGFMSLILVSCNDVSGNLHVLGDFSLTQNGVEFEIDPGIQEATLKFKSKKKIQLKLKLNGEKHSFDFDLAREYDFPRRNGNFRIPAEENSQGYDIIGEIRTLSERSRRYMERESCTVREWRTRCRNTRRGRICERIPVTRYGWRDVEFYFVDTQETVNIQLKQAMQVESVAVFDAENHYRRKEEVYRGRCW